MEQITQQADVYARLPKNKQERVGRMEKQLGLFLVSQGFTVQPQVTVEGFDGNYTRPYFLDFKLQHPDYPQISLYVEFDELGHLYRNESQRAYDEKRSAHLITAGYKILTLACYQKELTSEVKENLLEAIFDQFDDRFIRSNSEWAARLTLVYRNYAKNTEIKQLKQKLNDLLYCTTDDENCTLDGAEI